jgi:hypothetical protein
MNHTLRHILSPIIVLALWCFVPFPTFAQWQIMERPEDNWGVVQSIAELRCGSSTLLLAGTSEGVFLDRVGIPYHAQNAQSNNTVPTGTTLGAREQRQARWLNISNGIPQHLRDIRSLHVVDSTIFALSAHGGVYYTTLSCLRPESTSLLWRSVSGLLPATEFSVMVAHNNILFLGTNQGVWAARLERSRGYKQLAWMKVGATFTADVTTLHVFENALVAGTRLNGAFRYTLGCEDCQWQDVGAFDRTPTNVLSMGTLSTTLTTPSRHNSSVVLPCSGLLLSAGTARLLLRSMVNPDAKTYEWLDISPARFHRRFRANINAILTGNVMSTPNAILVGTDSRGVLFSDDCGLTWQDLNEDADNEQLLYNADVRTLREHDGVVLAGLKTSDVEKGAKVAALFGKTVPRSTVANAAAQINDSTRGKDARIYVNTDRVSERGIVQVSMNEPQYIEVIAYNVLGKKVMDIYSGEAKTGNTMLPFDTTPLSNGIYICVVRGKNFKLAEKFLVSR